MPARVRTAHEFHLNPVATPLLARYVRPVIVLTFDQDWAPAWATLAIHEQLLARGMEATLFVTHPCPSLETLRDSGSFELAWHPNYQPGSSHGDDVGSVLDTMTQLVPNAKGVRAHALVRSTALLLEYGRRGLQYEASDLLFGWTHIRPIVEWNNVVRLPIFWEDDVHLCHGLPCDLASIDLAGSGLRVFNFHPVLVALNAADLAGYDALKIELAEQGESLTDATKGDVDRFRETIRPGIGDFLDELLAYLDNQPQQAGPTLAALTKSVLGETEAGE